MRPGGWLLALGAAGGAALLLAGLLLRQPAEPAPAAAPAADSPGRPAASPVPHDVEAPDPPVTPQPAPAPGATAVTGLVLRTAGLGPLPGATVELRAGGKSLASTETDALGRFELAVPDGLASSELHAAWQPRRRWLDWGAEQESLADRPPVRGSLRLTAADLAPGNVQRLLLDTGWSLGGTLGDGRGGLVAGARIALDGQPVADADPAGSFIVRDIDRRLEGVRLTASLLGHVTRTLDVAAPPRGEHHVRVQLDLPGPGELRGTLVHENGTPAAQAELALVARGTLGPGPFTVRTDERGAFELVALPEGRYDLVARVSDDAGLRSGLNDVAAETWVRDLDPAGKAGLELRLVTGRGLELHGTCVDAAGRPLAGHLVVARELRDPPMDPALWPPAASAEVDAAGRFTLRRLQPGSKLLTVEGRPEGCEHEGFVFPPREGFEAGPPSSQSGAAPGVPRPVELAQELDVLGPASEVALVVRAPQGTERERSRYVPFASRLAAAQASGHEFDLIAAGAVRQSLRIVTWQSALELPRSGPSCGILRVTCGGHLPDHRLVHDLRLLPPITLDLVPAPRLDIAVVEARGGEPAPATSEGGASPVASPVVTVRWWGGGRLDAVEHAGAGIFHADRPEGHWEATVTAPGLRRQRLAGDIPGPGEVLRVDVVLKPW